MKKSNIDKFMALCPSTAIVLLKVNSGVCIMCVTDLNNFNSVKLTADSFISDRYQ